MSGADATAESVAVSVRNHAQEFMPPDALATCANIATVEAEGNTLLSRVEGTQDVSLDEAQQPWGHRDSWAETRFDALKGAELLRLDTILSTWEAKSIGQGLSDGTKGQYRPIFKRYSAFAQL